MEPKRIQTRISPRHIYYLFTPSLGHISHAQSTVVALLADLLPRLAAHAHSVAIWPLYLYQGMMPVLTSPVCTRIQDVRLVDEVADDACG